MDTKAQLREAVKQQVEQFLVNGGKVAVLPYKDAAKEKKDKKKVTA